VAENGCERVVRILLANDKVNPNWQDTNGESALSWAKINRRESVVRLLQEHVDSHTSSILGKEEN
jgi:ankyrin repeat protein